MIRNYYVYILTNINNSVLYTGVTSDIHKRLYQHKQAESKKSFTGKYNVKKLVYFELHHNVEEAIKREKNIKKWNRAWKEELIEKNNPGWLDLYNEIID